MENSTLNSKRIVKNTIVLYVRLLFTLVVGLYTSRVILHALGFSDYGLYNVVGGFVSIFGFLNHSLSAGTQRFLSISIGRSDEKETSEVFASSLYLHLCLSGIVFLLAQTIGLWFIMEKMNIETDRLVAAIWVFEFSIIASMVQIIQVPFMSSLIAHEKMDIYAYISIFEVSLKLLIVYIIQASRFDKLIIYAFLILLVQLIISVLYTCYCRKHYAECRFSIRFSKKILKDVASFSGWNILGMLATTCQGQGINVLLNLLFGSVVNAARGLAFQVNNILLQFANNFLTAVNPQIFKLYANNELEKLFKLIKTSSLMAAYLLLILMMPLFVDIEYILSLWLGDYPEYTSSFIRIVFVQSIMSAIIRPVILLIFAIGKMKMPNLVGGSMVLLAIPFAYFANKLGGDPTIVFLVSMVPWLLEEISDLFFANKYIGFPVLNFYLTVYLRIILIAVLLYYTMSSIYEFLDYSKLVNFLILSVFSFSISVLVIYVFGIDRQTRNVMNKLVRQRLFSIIK